MFKAFADESGNNTRDVVLVCGAWVGSVEQWGAFPDAWEQSLTANNPKPLVPYKGEVYFKHSEALACSGCFAGFTDKEAEQKTISLANIITQYDVGGLATVIDRRQYERIVDDMVLKKSGKLYNDYVRDPLFIGLHMLVGLVLGTQYVISRDDKVDFIFDEGGMTNRVVSMYEFIRENIPGDLKRIMGSAIALNDKQVMPLQAADLWAGQIRMAARYHGHPTPLLLLRQSNRNWILSITEKDIRIFLSLINVATSTRKLERLNAERLGLATAQQRSRNRKKPKSKAKKQPKI